jgi:hypothetical protein
MKEIKDMNLAECLGRLRELPNGTITDPFETGDAPWIFDVAAELADRIQEIYQEHAKTIEDLRDILEDRRRTAEEEHGRNMNEANL